MELNERIKYANHQRYVDGNEVEAYLKEPYHRIRVETACKLLEKHLTARFQRTELSKLTIVELGAGSGFGSKLLASRGFKVIATDSEPDPLKGLTTHGITTRVIDVTETFPIDSCSVHGVLVGELVEHIFDAENFIGQCARILVPNGILVVTTPNLAGLQDRLRFLFGLSPRQIDASHEYLKLHIRPYTWTSLKKLFRLSGFEPLEVKSNHLRFDIGRFKLKSRLLGCLLPTLSGSLIAAACRRSDLCDKAKSI